MPTAESVWRELRSLRAVAPGAAASNSARAALFTTALEQAQEFLFAARNAGTATRPVQIFYGLSQLGRAIAAASLNLPDTGPVLKPNGAERPVHGEPWNLKSHGITNPDLRSQSDRRLADITVKGAADGTFGGVAAALGGQSLPVGIEVAVGDCWASLPEAVHAPLQGMSTVRALFAKGFYPVGQGHYVGLQGQVTSEYNGPANNDEIRALFERYPSLRHGQAGSLPGAGFNPIVRTPNHWIVEIYFALQPDGDGNLHPFRACADPYRGDDDRWVFPTVAGSPAAVHPLLSWWAVLYTLSMLSRYECVTWNRMIDINTSVEATAIEHILDEALTVVPHLALEAIRHVSS